MVAAALAAAGPKVVTDPSALAGSADAASAEPNLGPLVALGAAGSGAGAGVVETLRAYWPVALVAWYAGWVGSAAWARRLAAGWSAALDAGALRPFPALHSSHWHQVQLAVAPEGADRFGQRPALAPHSSQPPFGHQVDWIEPAAASVNARRPAHRQQPAPVAQQEQPAEPEPCQSVQALWLVELLVQLRRLAGGRSCRQRLDPSAREIRAAFWQNEKSLPPVRHWCVVVLRGCEFG